MSEPWHDINVPGHLPLQKGKNSDLYKSITGIDNSIESEKKRAPIEYRIKFIRPLEPPQGFRTNESYFIEGEIEALVETITMPRIKIYPAGVYKGIEDNFYPNGIDTFPDKNGCFKVTCEHLYVPMNYINDTEKTEDSTWELIIRAKGKSAEKENRSRPVTFPQPQKPLIK